MPHRIKVLKTIQEALAKEFPTAKIEVRIRESVDHPGFVLKVTIPIEGSTYYVVEQNVDINPPWDLTVGDYGYIAQDLVRALRNRPPPPKEPLPALTRVARGLFP